MAAADSYEMSESFYQIARLLRKLFTSCVFMERDSSVSVVLRL
jgi:hypothetical protein